MSATGAGTLSLIDLSNLSKFLVVFNNWITLIEVVLNSLLDGLGVIVGSAACLSSLHASLKHDLLWHLVVKDLLGLDDVLLKILGLVNSSGETVN